MYRPFRGDEETYEEFRAELAKLYENDTEGGERDVKLMSTKEAGELIGLDARGVRLLINLGLLRAIRLGKRKWRIREIDIDRHEKTWIKVTYR